MPSNALICLKTKAGLHGVMVTWFNVPKFFKSKTGKGLLFRIKKLISFLDYTYRKKDFRKTMEILFILNFDVKIKIVNLYNGVAIHLFVGELSGLRCKKKKR
jgi:hypothetical protein